VILIGPSRYLPSTNPRGATCFRRARTVANSVRTLVVNRASNRPRRHRRVPAARFQLHQSPVDPNGSPTKNAQYVEVVA